MGVVLVVGIVVVASVGILFVATETIADAEERSALEHVEQSFNSLSASVETGGATDDSVREIDLAVSQRSGELRVVEDGEIDVSVGNQSLFPSGPIPLNAIEYESRSGTTVVYQGGGVWRSDGDSTSIVSPPKFHYRDQTLSLPVATIGADRLESDSLTVRSERNATHYTGVVVGGPLTINVTTSYDDAWVRYFEFRFPDADVTVVPGATPEDPRTVVVTLDVVVPPGPPQPADPLDVRTPIDGVLAVNGTAGMKGGQLDGNVTAAGDVTVSVNPSTSGTIRAAGDVYVDAPVDGDVIAGGDIHMRSGVRIDGTAIAGGNILSSGGGGGMKISGDAVSYGDISISGTIDGVAIATGSISPTCGSSGCYPNQPVSNISRHPDDYLANFSEYKPLDDAIDEMIDAGESSGANFTVLTGGETLEAGTHYVDSIDTSSSIEDITLDAEDGDVHVVIRGDVTLDNAQFRLKVVNSGDNVARIFLGSDFSILSGGQYFLCPWEDPGGCVEDANALQIYGTSDMTFQLRQGARVNGFIYAPEATADIDNDPNMFGAAVFGSFIGDNDANFEFDEKLRTDFDPPTSPAENNGDGLIPSGSTQPGAVRFLHVTGYDVDIET